MSYKRNVDFVVISDTHLGTYGAHADELVQYLESIEPKTLVLNGDIIDMWQFKKRYFPQSHTKVLHILSRMITEGVKVVYITGNHDDALRTYSPMRFSNFQLVDKLITMVNGKRVWIFHGDIFDSSIQHAKWVARLGGIGYDLLIRFNRMVNKTMQAIGRSPISLSKKVKDNIKNAVKYISDFEQSAIDLAIEQEYDYVICGHIHQATIRKVENIKGSTIYMNSGDWVENLTALEYNDGEWSLFRFNESNLKYQKRKTSRKSRVRYTSLPIFQQFEKEKTASY